MTIILKFDIASMFDIDRTIRSMVVFNGFSFGGISAVFHLTAFHLQLG